MGYQLCNYVDGRRSSDRMKSCCEYSTLLSVRNPRAVVLKVGSLTSSISNPLESCQTCRLRGPTPHLLNQKLSGWGPALCCIFDKPSRWVWCIKKLENFHAREQCELSLLLHWDLPTQEPVTASGVSVLWATNHGHSLSVSRYLRALFSCSAAEV